MLNYREVIEPMSPQEVRKLKKMQRTNLLRIGGIMLMGIFTGMVVYNGFSGLSIWMMLICVASLWSLGRFSFKVYHLQKDINSSEIRIIQGRVNDRIQENYESRTEYFLKVGQLLVEVEAEPYESSRIGDWLEMRLSPCANQLLGLYRLPHPPAVHRAFFPGIETLAALEKKEKQLLFQKFSKKLGWKGIQIGAGGVASWILASWILTLSVPAAPQTYKLVSAVALTVVAWWPNLAKSLNPAWKRLFYEQKKVLTAQVENKFSASVEGKPFLFEWNAHKSAQLVSYIQLAGKSIPVSYEIFRELQTGDQVRMHMVDDLPLWLETPTRKVSL